MVLHGNLGDLHKAALDNRHGFAVKSTAAKEVCLSEHRRIASHATGYSPTFREEPHILDAPLNMRFWDFRVCF